MSSNTTTDSNERWFDASPGPKKDVFSSPEGTVTGDTIGSLNDHAESSPEASPVASRELSPEVTPGVIPKFNSEPNPEAHHELGLEPIPVASPKAHPEAVPKATSEASSKPGPEVSHEPIPEPGPVPTRVPEVGFIPWVHQRDEHAHLSDSEKVKLLEEVVASREADLLSQMDQVERLMKACEDWEKRCRTDALDWYNHEYPHREATYLEYQSEAIELEEYRGWIAEEVKAQSTRILEQRREIVRLGGVVELWRLNAERNKARYERLLARVEKIPGVDLRGISEN